jgi:hypothetical protein
LKPASDDTALRRADAVGDAGLSILVPGLGQLRQRRIVAAATQFGTVAVYVIGALRFADHRAVWLAVGWNLWSAIDAYLHERA